MAVAREALLAGGVGGGGAAGAAARPRRRWGERVGAGLRAMVPERARRDAKALADVVRMVRFFAGGFARPGLGMVLIGAAIVAWDILVPVVGARVVDAMAAGRPLEEVALLIVGLTAVVWVPHGNLLPYFLERLNARRLGFRLLGEVSVRGLRLALLNPENVRRVALGELARGDAQPILVEGRENLARLVDRVVREIPVALRGLAVLCLLAWMVPPFVPLLLLGAFADLAITCRMGRRLEPRFAARQEAENAQRRRENDLLARHFGERLSPGEVERAAAAYEAAVRDRVEKEIAAEVPALGYKLKRDLVFNFTNIGSWLVGAWYVVVAGNPIGTFLFFVAWSSRANELFTAIMNLQQEVMRARRSIERLGALVGLEQGRV